MNKKEIHHLVDSIEKLLSSINERLAELESIDEKLNKLYKDYAKHLQTSVDPNAAQ